MRTPKSGETVHYVNKKGECQPGSILRIDESDADRGVIDVQLAQPAEHQREQYLLRPEVPYQSLVGEPGHEGDPEHKTWHYVEEHD